MRGLGILLLVRLVFGTRRDRRVCERSRLLGVRTVTCHCGKVETVDADSLRSECFKHHVQGGISFNFVGGGTYGRSSWNDQTLGEAQREIVDGAAANGVEVEPVGSRWV